MQSVSCRSYGQLGEFPIRIWRKPAKTCLSLPWRSSREGDRGWLSNRQKPSPPKQAHRWESSPSSPPSLHASSLSTKGYSDSLPCRLPSPAPMSLVWGKLCVIRHTYGAMFNVPMFLPCVKSPGKCKHEKAVLYGNMTKLLPWFDTQNTYVAWKSIYLIRSWDRVKGMLIRDFLWVYEGLKLHYSPVKEVSTKLHLLLSAPVGWATIRFERSKTTIPLVPLPAHPCWYKAWCDFYCSHVSFHRPVTWERDGFGGPNQDKLEKVGNTVLMSVKRLDLETSASSILEGTFSPAMKTLLLSIAGNPWRPCTRSHTGVPFWRSKARRQQYGIFWPARLWFGNSVTCGDLWSHESGFGLKGFLKANSIPWLHRTRRAFPGWGYGFQGQLTMLDC